MKSLALSACRFVAPAIATFCLSSAPVYAQPEGAEQALKEAHENLVSVLDQVDDLFYKQKTAEDGTIFYTVMWQADGETTKIILGLKELGYFNSKYVYGLSAWTYVVSSDSAVPPAVIKLVASANDSLAIGSYSTSADFKNVYANMSGVLKNATPDEIWMYIAYLHSNRLKLKQQVDQAMAGASQ